MDQIYADKKHPALLGAGRGVRDQISEGPATSFVLII